MGRGLIRSYGLFWRIDEVKWSPGRGSKRQFRLLGRVGARSPGLRVADFRQQRGIYILYGNYGPHYVGLTRKQALGKRLKDHLHDHHAGKWDRFSWFGFRQVLQSRDRLSGLLRLKEIPRVSALSASAMIGDIEALLIMSMALRNVARMKFADADEWQQIKLDEVERYLKRFGAT